MKILQLSSAHDFGGGERHLLDLCGGLSQLGHEIYAVHRPRATWAAKLSSIQRFTLPLRNALDVWSAWRLARLIRTQQIDILHAHLARDYPIAALAARWAQCRWVVTRHVMFPLKRLHRLTLRRVSGAIAVSQPVAFELLRVLPAEKVRVIQNGLDLARFAAVESPTRARFGLNPAHLLVGTLGDLRPLKGPDDFLRAAAQITATRSDVSFVLAGPDTSPDGSDRRRLEKLLSELGLTGRVALAGWQENAAEFYHALDVFVSASRSESFGLTIVEAMAAGVPVVATATDGAREIINDGVNGKLVGKPSGLAGTIGELLANSTLRKELATRAQADVRARFSLAQMAEATARLYQQTYSQPS